MGREERSRLTPIQEQPPNGGRIGERVVFIVVSSVLGLVSLLLFVQLLILSRQVRYEQKEIEELQEELRNEQKGQIEHLSEQVQKEQTLTVYNLAGMFTLLASLITLFHMTAHLRHFREPFVQRKILAILMMVPIYGITSFVGLVFPTIRGYLDIIKDFYEAYVIYQFLSFLIAVLGKGNRDAVVELLARHADHLKPPLKCLNCCFYPDPHESDRALANAVLLESQIFAMQFVLVRPLTTVAIFVVDMLDSDHSMPTWDPRYPRFYIVMLQNISVFLAFTGLVKFYRAVHEDLEWCRPWPKFLCIKGVVFMTFWQGLVISLLANAAADRKSEDDDFDPRDWAFMVQDLLICVEMLVFSLAHFLTFPTDEWEEGYRPRQSSARFGDKIALGDFVSDVKFVVGSHQSRRQRKYGEEDGENLESSSTLPSTNDGNEFEEEDEALHLVVEKP